MDLLHLPWFRKIGEIFKRSILLLHVPLLGRIMQILHTCFVGRRPEKQPEAASKMPHAKAVTVTRNFDEKTTTFILPDLVSLCKFPVRYHPDGDEIAKESAEWLDANCPGLTTRQRKAIYGLQGGVLAAYSYTTGPKERLRVIADYINYLFHLDNISDRMLTREADVLGNIVMNAILFPEEYKPMKDQPEEEPIPGKLSRDIWRRCIRHAGPGVQKRFINTMQEFFDAISTQAKTRADSEVPDLESYIDCRRDTSACKPCWALIEYIHDFDLPDYVAEHPIIEALGEAANDLVSWANDIYSYNIEQARGEGYHNLVYILMHHHGHSLQGAVDHAAEMWTQTVDKFIENERRLPSWGPEIDEMVQKYVSGLRDWSIGSVYWSFRTHRYFGTDGLSVMKHRTVEVIPNKVEPLFPGRN
ncbi:hypothetical protein AX15_006423 [Amanita polypyramis BW_CC]|nr:hypothetical protein AX15_006423 [Amanita polypyramis BW_CC]